MTLTADGSQLTAGWICGVKKGGQERDFVANAKVKFAPQASPFGQNANFKMMGREADVWGKKVGPFNYSG